MEYSVFQRKVCNFPKYIIHRLTLSWYWFLSGVAKRSFLGIMFPRLIPFIWRCIGCNIGRNVCFGSEVYLDVDYANQLTIEDDVWIASRAIIFAHRREMREYYCNTRYKDCSQKKRPVLIKKGACLSIGAMVMPGITIGEGSIVGAGALVTKDVPDWCIVAGNPAKIIRFLKEKDDKSDN